MRVSGGEKKRTEVLQLAVLEPSIAFLDETDWGLILMQSELSPRVNTLRGPKMVCGGDHALSAHVELHST